MPSIKLDEEAVRQLCSYNWPGNIRQLKNIAEQISVIESQREVDSVILSSYLSNSNGNKNLPMVIDQKKEDDSFSERDLLYKVLFDLKNDVTEMKRVIVNLINNNELSKNEKTAIITRLHTNEEELSNHQSPVINDFTIEHKNEQSTFQESFQESVEIEESLSLEEREKELIQKHKNFIWFSSPGVFVGNSINLITLIFFTHYYGEQFSGLLAAAIQYLGLLIMMFSSSFAQVYYNEIAQIKDSNKLLKSYTYWLKRLLMMTLLGWIILVFTPSTLLTMILGEKWSGLMVTIKIISPWMAVMFVASSLSYIFIRLGKQKEVFFFDIFHLLIILFGLLIGHYFLNDQIQILYIISSVQTLFYILSISLALKFLFENLKNENAPN